MPPKSKTRFDAKRAWRIAGLALLWPCLQSSGFYPLSLSESAASADAALVARFHLLYSLALIVAFCAIIGLRKQTEGRLCSSVILPVIAGALGATGQAFLVFGNAFDKSALPATIASMLCVAVYIATFVTMWGCRIAHESSTRTVFNIAVSYLASQILIIAYCFTGLPHGFLLCACTLGTTVCAVLSPQHLAVDRADAPTPKRKFPYAMVSLVVLLIYFCIIYVRLRIESFTGDSAIAHKLFASTICASVFVVVVSYLARKHKSENSFVVIFVFLVSLYMIGLAAIMLTSGGEDTLARRMLIAGEHCLEVFLWMLLSSLIVRNRLSPIVTFGLYGIAAVAVPWILSFDLRYLTNIANIILSNNLLTSIVTIALCATALGTVAFLTSYALQIAKESVKHAGAAQQETVQQALAEFGLTQREMDVAVLVFRGYSAKKIAEMLYISEPTVKSYTSRVYRKLGIHSKQELIECVDERSTLL